MAHGTSQSSRTRWAAAPMQTPLYRMKRYFRHEGVWLRVLICTVASLVLLIISIGWLPAFPYRVRQVLPRDLSARATFQYEDPDATQQARQRAASKVLCLYEHDPQPLRDLRQVLSNEIFKLIERRQHSDALETWKDFFLPPTIPNENEVVVTPTVETLDRFLAGIASDSKLEKLIAAVDRAFIDIDRYGLLESISHEMGDGSVRELKVFTKGNMEDAVAVEISNVRIAEIANTIRQSIRTELESNKDVITDSEFVAERIYEWLRPKLMPTLTWDQSATARERKAAAKAVEPKMRTFEIGDPLQNLFSEQKNVVGGSIPLVASDISLLRAEHTAFVSSVSWTSRGIRAALFFGLAMTCFSLFARYLWQRHRLLLMKWNQFASLVAVFCLTFGLMWLCVQSDVESRLEIVPIVLFSMTIAIAYQIGLAIMMSTLAVLLFTISHGYDLPEFVILASASCAAGLFCQSIRSRTKSVYIGLFTAAVVFPVSVAIQIVMNSGFHSAYLVDAMWYAGGAGFAGLVMTALLPFLERWFDIQTDISLLELSDPNHPLLKQLVQRAPGTYNHSINVASIAETAADAIGANGLMCRVGAYFHDIGKMRKPEYFVENQGEGVSKHDELEPTMSRLVIVSHVKDGIELAKKYHLPRRIVDLIEQHHGTTIVAFFYHRAAKQSIEPEGVDESSFRYPGPKPQTPEAAVLMLADAVEGACRSLREPGPARIENVVREITKAKLDDGQFDQCHLTIQQLRTIQASLTKSLNAMYHGRIKYPDSVMVR